VTLDIDIYRNEPRILKKQVLPNSEGWRGTEITVTISGHWGNYRSRVLQYFQQLAVITPYAKLAVDFKCHRDAKKSFRADFERRYRFFGVDYREQCCVEVTGDGHRDLCAAPPLWVG
jgi:hypothetical protein